MSGIMNSGTKLLTGVDNKKQQKLMDQYSKQMQGMVGRQATAYDQAMPEYQKVLDYYSNRAGLGSFMPAHQTMTGAATLDPNTQHYYDPGYSPPAPTMERGLNNQGQMVSAPRPVNNYQGPITPPLVSNSPFGNIPNVGQMANPLTGKKLTPAGKGDPNGAPPQPDFSALQSILPLLLAMQQQGGAQMGGGPAPSGMGDPNGYGGIFNAVKRPQQQQQQTAPQPFPPAPAGMPGMPAPQGAMSPQPARPPMVQPATQPAQAPPAPPAPRPATPAPAAAAPAQPVAHAAVQPPAGPQLNQNPYLNGPPAAAGVTNQQLGIYNMNDQDRFANAAAQDDIGRMQQQQQSQLLHSLGQRGMADSSIYGGSLAQLGENALQQYSDYRRKLAMQSGTEQDQRVQNLMNALNPSLGYGQQAMGNLNQLYGNSQQLSQQSAQALQGLFNSGTQLASLFML